MIPMIELRRAIAALLKARFPHAVYFTSNAQADTGYFYIELAPRTVTFDRVLYEREIDVSISLVLPPDARGRVPRGELYAAADKLGVALLPVLHVGDRVITVRETSARIVDEVLHYSFTLPFADAVPEESAELMNELQVNGI